jgi:hypothetical protein
VEPEARLDNDAYEGRWKPSQSQPKAQPLPSDLAPLRLKPLTGVAGEGCGWPAGGHSFGIGRYHRTVGVRGAWIEWIMDCMVAWIVWPLGLHGWARILRSMTQSCRAPAGMQAIGPRCTGSGRMAANGCGWWLATMIVSANCTLTSFLL